MRITLPTGSNLNVRLNFWLGNYLEDALTMYANDHVKAYNKFLLAQVFKAAAPENVRKLMSHKDQTVDDAYQTFFTEHRVEMDKRQSALNTIHAMKMSQSKILKFRNKIWPHSDRNHNRSHDRSLWQLTSRGRIIQRQFQQQAKSKPRFQCFKKW